MKQTALIALLTLVMSSPAFASGKAPEKTHGLSAVALEAHELAAQIPVMSNYQLRARRVTFEPGGATSLHSHAMRPGIVYVERGEIVEIRSGEKRTFKAGETWNETADTEHWVKNASDQPAVLIIIDLPKS